MLNFGILLAILLLGLVSFVCAIDYCDPALCTINFEVKRHVGCKNTGEFFSYCIEPAVIPVTPELQKKILYMHNDLRNKVANGSLSGFQSAQRMTTMTWDKELAYLAGLNVLQCEMEHDECRNTYAYKHAGQNLGMRSQENVPFSPTEYEMHIVYIINAWFNEYTLANQADVDICSAKGIAKDIGHFTAMIHQKSAKVGCAIARFIRLTSGRYAILLACNYSFTNMVDMPIYLKGRMASGCQTGTNPEFNGLCSVSENVPPVHDFDLPQNGPQRLEISRPIRSNLGVPPIQHKSSGLRAPQRVPSARMAELMRIAEPVVRPYDPNQQFYIRHEPNPEITHHDIIRYVPSVTWRGPRTAAPPVEKKCDQWPFKGLTRF